MFTLLDIHFFLFLVQSVCTPYMGHPQLGHHLWHTNKASSLPFLYPTGHIFLVPHSRNFLRKSSQPTGSLRMIIGRNKNSSLHSFISPSLNSLILHSVICIRTLSNLLQKESLSLCAQITSVACSCLRSFPFLSPCLHIANIWLGFAIKGATSFSYQGKLQVAGECYTTVEVHQRLSYGW